VRVLVRHPSVALLALASLAWLAGCVALAGAAGDLARGLWYTPAALLAVHLIGLGFLTTAIAGALLQLAPNMSDRRPPGGAGAGLVTWAEAAGGALLTAGIGWLLAGVVAVWVGRRGS
jgi:hypothetical protein